jgi:hypothetical protein
MARNAVTTLTMYGGWDAGGQHMGTPSNALCPIP